jgi:hypothetical protein
MAGVKRERLNLDAVEAALTEYTGRNPATDKELQERLRWFQDAVDRSPHLFTSVLGFIKFLRLPLRDGVTKQYEQESGRTLSNVELEAHRVMTIAAQFFFIGWEARGAVDEADQLKRMTGMKSEP